MRRSGQERRGSRFLDRKPRRFARSVERLESRDLLSADPWQNPVDRYDVMGNGQITPADALAIIDALNRGITTLPAVTASSGSTMTPQSLGYLDVEGTGVVTPQDALVIIDALTTGFEMTNSLVTTDMNGNPITTVSVGTQFKLEDFVQDTCAVSAATGVASAYSDVTYPSSSATISTISYPSDFPLDQKGNIATAGAINQVGAAATTAPASLTSSELLWSVPVTATAAAVGTSPLIFTNGPDAMDGSSEFKGTAAVPTSQINYFGAKITVTAASLPTLSVNSVSVAEPSAGSSAQVIFTVSLSSPSTQNVTFNYSTENGTALAGTDYTGVTNQTVTIPAGQTSVAIPAIAIQNNPTFNSSGESFSLNLTSPTFATVPTGQGTGTCTIGAGTITGTPGEPTVSIQGTTVAETGSGSQSATFTINLSSAATQNFTVGYSTEDGTAVQPTDYTQQLNGTVPITVGEKSVTFSVALQQTVTTLSKTFLVDLTPSTSYAILSGEATATLLPPGSLTTGTPLAAISVVLTDTKGNAITASNPLTVGEQFLADVEVQDVDPNLAEPNAGVYYAYTDLGWTPGVADMTSGSSVTYTTYQTQNATNTFTSLNLINVGGTGPDSAPVSVGGVIAGVTVPTELVSIPMTALEAGTLTFTPFPANDLPGTTFKDVGLFSSNPANPNETRPPVALINYSVASVSVGSSSSSGGGGSGSSSTSNDFSLTGPSSVNNVTLGTTTATFTVTRTLPDNTAITVPISTSGGTAVAGSDYEPLTNYPLNFGAGQTTATFSVTLIGNSLYEASRTLTVTLGTPVLFGTTTQDGTLVQPSVTATIVSAVSEPSITVASVSEPEGEPLQFIVNLSAASDQPVTVGFNTAPTASGNTAVAGTDYQTTSGTLTFLPGQTQQIVTVNTLYNPLNTTGKTLQLDLTSPTNATFSGTQIVGTITYVLPTSISGYVYVDTNDSGIFTSNDVGLANVTVTLTSTTPGFTPVTTITNASGYYVFSGLNPGTYSVTKTNPGFYVDGKETPGTPAPTGPNTEDQFNGIVIASGTNAVNYNFAEQGLRSDFISAFINRRAFLSSSIVTGEYGPSTIANSSQTFNLQAGAVWISFDNGWQGPGTITAAYNPAQGSVTMTLYDNNLNPLTSSSSGQISYSGVLGAPYFLEITGSNPNVSLNVNISTTALTSSSTAGSSTTTGTSGSGNLGTATFAAVSARVRPRLPRQAAVRAPLPAKTRLRRLRWHKRRPRRR